MNESKPLLFVFMILFLILAFYLLSSTAEDYLEPVLTTLAQKFRFSESLAGVTLVALANGANDVFAAIAAGGSPNARILLPVGALFGAGLFVSTIVLAVCILFSKEGSIKLNPSALTRDCLFYFLGGAWILFEGLKEKIIGYVGSIGLFSIYAIFIGVVIVQEIRIKRAERIRVREELDDTERRPSFQVSLHEEMDAFGMEPDLRGSNLSLLLKDQHMINPQVDGDSFTETLAVREASLPSVSQLNAINMRREGLHSSIVKVRFQYQILRQKVKKELKEMREKGIFGKCLTFIKMPFNFVRDLTIPPSTQDKWNKYILMIQPFLVILFFLWQWGYASLFQGGTGWIAWVLYAFSASAISLFFWRVTKLSEVPQGILGLALLVVSFVSGVTWINYFANIFVDFISLLSVYTGLPYNYLGLTVLAWGNSLNDLFVDSALAKKGLGQVAVSGVVAGQYFNLSMGFGVSLIVQATTFGPGDFNLLEGTHIADVSLILICCLMLSMLSTMIYGYWTNFHLKKVYAIYLVALYVSFLTAATLLTVVYSDGSS